MIDVFECLTALIENNKTYQSLRLYLRSDFATCPIYNHFYKKNDDMANKIDDMAYS